MTKEVRIRFDIAEDITAENLAAKMPYLNAVIEEGLRLCPPVGIPAYCSRRRSNGVRKLGS